MTKFEVIIHHTLNDYSNLMCKDLDGNLGTYIDESFKTHLSVKMIKTKAVNVF